MNDPIFDPALLSMCMTWRHDFGLLDRKEQMAVKRELLRLYEHHVKPSLERAEAAESELAAMRQRAEEAEKIVELAKNIIRTGQVEPDAGMDGNILAPTYDFAILDGALSRYDAVLPSPPADASTMGGERDRRLAEALRHVCEHLCQWKDACETGCLVSAALDEMEQKP